MIKMVLGVVVGIGIASFFGLTFDDFREGVNTAASSVAQATESTMVEQAQDKFNELTNK